MNLNPKRSLMIIAVVSVLVGGVAVWLSADYIQGRVSGIRTQLEGEYEMMPVVAASVDLARGGEINRTNLRVVHLPKRFVPKQAIHPKQLSRIEGARLVVDVAANQPVLTNFVTRGAVLTGSFSSQITDGMRAVTFPVDMVSSVGGLLNPGDKIDLLATMRMQNQEGLVTLPLLDNLEILAVGEVFQGENDRRYQHITLELSPTDSARLLQARQEGSLTAVLRSPEDQNPGFAKAMTMEGLFSDSFGRYFKPPSPPASKLPLQEMMPQRLPIAPPRVIDVIIGGRG
ncbi:MAG TPA: Flp pilus assembly protein CpaB [Marinobacter sp.]|uniref:Flp pilus assembly protein CpaB n=2 Tax=root TaxID=1 RepID=A0A831R6F0_9GAMM|nr:Flp pilus assembly protein CpaB [Marinobacter antarcticus]HDZ38934.1 Flp pilus assembly protein CpaB [Marinobacter sp.]HEA53663.1 Flp pilus assembly protein CpaB [Marinobacter antarcticus]